MSRGIVYLRNDVRQPSTNPCHVMRSLKFPAKSDGRSIFTYVPRWNRYPDPEQSNWSPFNFSNRKYRTRGSYQYGLRSFRSSVLVRSV